MNNKITYQIYKSPDGFLAIAKGNTSPLQLEIKEHGKENVILICEFTPNNYGEFKIVYETIVSAGSALHTKTFSINDYMS